MKLRYKLLIALPLLGVVSVGVLLWGVGYTGQRALDEAMAGVVADGGPADFLWLDRPGLADEDNAAVAWSRAVEPLEAIDAAAQLVVWPEEPDAAEVSSADWFGGGYAPDFSRAGEAYQPEVEAIREPSEADPVVLRSAIDKRQAVIEDLWAAAELEEVCWPLDYANPSVLLEGMTYLGDVGRAARLLGADAHAALGEGDDARADRSLAAALSAAEDLMAVPLALNVLVAISIDTQVCDALAANGGAALARMPETRSVLAARDYRAWLATAHLAEPAYFVAQDYGEAQWSKFLWDEDNPVPAGLRGIAGRLWRRHDLAFNVELHRDMSRLSRRPHFETLAEIEAVVGQNVPAVFPISRQAVDVVPRTNRTAAQIDTRRVLALWASAPDAPPPTDPFVGGALMRWRAPDGGVVLWSAAAATPPGGDEWVSRSPLVWRIGTRELPPELMPFADELNDIGER